MPLLNYTTEIPAAKSIGEIMTILQQAGARAIMLENGADRQIEAISQRGTLALTAPASYVEPRNVTDI